MLLNRWLPGVKISNSLSSEQVWIPFKLLDSFMNLLKDLNVKCVLFVGLTSFSACFVSIFAFFCRATLEVLLVTCSFAAGANVSVINPHTHTQTRLKQTKSHSIKNSHTLLYLRNGALVFLFRVLTSALARGELVANKYHVRFPV